LVVLVAGFVEKVLMPSRSSNFANVHQMDVGAYGSTPGRNALHLYGILALHRKIRMFFSSRIFESIRNKFHLEGFSTRPSVKVSKLID